MTKNTSVKKSEKKNSDSIVSAVNSNINSILSINRNSSTFIDFPSLPIELEALNKVYQSIGKRIADNKALQSEIEAKQQVINAIESIAVKAWQYHAISKMGIPYLEQTRQQAIDIHHDMLRCIETMPDRNKLTVNPKTTNKRSLSVTGNGNTKTKNENEQLVTSTIIQYDGCSFNLLPAEVQSQFTLNTADMYNKLKPFFHTVRNGTGKGKFALLYQTYGNTLTDQILTQTKQPMGLTLPDGNVVKTDTSSVRYMSLAINNF